MFKNIFKLFPVLFVLVMFLYPQSAYAQLTGTKTIPGDYATIEAAITDLNAQGVGTGGVTFDVAAGHTETFTSVLAGQITASGTTSDQIIFQKSGAGANPLITASGLGTVTTSTTNGAHGDGIIIIEAGDYITFDGIDLQENVAATGDQFMEYGFYLKKIAVSVQADTADDACKNVTIMNCDISLDKATRYSYGIYVSNRIGVNDAVVSSIGGASENIKIFNNAIHDCYGAIQLRGDTQSAPYAFYDQNIEIGVDGANTITDFGGGASSCYPIYAIYQNGLKVANNTINGGSGQTSTLYGIYLSTGNNSDVDVYNNTITLTSDATTSGFYGLYVSMGGTGTTNTVNIYDNIIENCTRPAVTSGSWYMIYRSSSAFNVNIYGNTIRNNSKGGTGTGYGLYSTSGGAGGTESIYDNDIYNNTNGTGTTYDLRSGAASTTTRTINNNNVYSNSGGGTHYGLYSTSGANVDIYGNNVYDLTSAGTMYGLYKTGGVTINVYENNIYDLESTTTSTSICYGIYSSTGTDVYYYNNFLSDLKNLNGTSTTGAVRGIYIVSGTNVGLYYNSVYLDYVGAATNTSAAFYASTSTTSLDLRNNIFVNNVDNSAGGTTWAFRGSGTAVLTDLAATTNNNLYYAGTPSATNLIYYDGTNTAQTMNEYKTLVSPLESASVSSLPPFVNTTTTPYDLHMDTSTPTQTESGGTPVTTPIAVSSDYDGDTRNATTPDIGADEFNGIGADLTPPAIDYTLLPNVDFNATSVVLTATITDASGVAGGANLPRLYIKKTTDVSYVFDNNPGVAGDDYTFTINYSAISGISIGDTIEYYVAAQDVDANAGTNPAGGSGSSPPGTTPPLTPNFYLVTDLPLSGTYTVGLTDFINKTGRQVYFETRTRTVTKNINGVDAVEDINTVDGETKTEILDPDLSPRYKTVTETYKQLMENGKPFDTKFFQESTDGIYPTLTAAVNDLTLRGMSGPVEFSLVDTYYPSETYPILIGDVTGASSTNTITIKPATGIQAEIPGDITQTAATIQVGYGDWVIIDGSNNGTTTKDLKIVGLAAGTYPAIHLWGDASNNVFKNLILESQNPSTGSGTFLFGSGPFASDNNLIQNCTIKNIDTIATRPGVGGYFFSSNTGTGNSFVGCDVYDFDDYGFRLQGAPIVNTLISECEVHMTDDVSTSLTYGAYVSRVEGLIIEKSKFYNFVGGTVRGIYLAGNSLSGDFTIRNNFISLAASADDSGILAGLDYWGYAANSFEAYHNSIYFGGTDVTGSSTTWALAVRDDANVVKLYNNAVYSARSNGTGTGTHYAVYVSDTNQVVREIDYNDFFVDGTGGVFGFYQGPGAITDLATWKTTTGLDANSVSGNPGFVGGDDLHVLPSIGVLDSKALYFAAVPDDIDGDTRNVTTPDIGADEYTYVPPAEPIFSISPPSKDFGTVNINESSLDQTFTISNIGVGTLIITSGNISIVGTDASQFVLTDGNTYPINLGAGETATIDVNFSPTTVGAKTADIQIVDNTTADATHLVPLTGTGFDPTISTFPYAEDFDTGSGTTPPIGWEQDPANVEDWEFNTSASYAAVSDHTSGTGIVAWVDDSTPYENPSNLISPPFDISGLTTPVASFYYWIGRETFPGGISYLNVDVYNGTTWTDSVITALVQNNMWASIDVDLTAYKSSNTKIRFRGIENLADFDCDISIDDFSLFDNTNPPNCALNVLPADLDTNVVIDTDLVWASGGGAPTGYILYFGTDGGGITPPTNLVNGIDQGNVTTYDHPTDLSYSTTYYWQVIAYNGFGNSTGCSIWSFTTQDDPTIVSFPWNDDLETPGAPDTPLGWTQDTGDDFDWTFDAGGTPSTGTGPSVDHNPGTALGTYGFTESSSNNGTTANIFTPPFDVSGLANPVFSIWYHMYGATMGSLSVDVSTDGGTTWTPKWSETGDKGDTWFQQEIVLPTNANLIRISGLTGSSFTSDMAFDDVSIYNNPNPPSCAVAVSPLDGVDSISIFTNLNWTSGGGAPTGYKLYFGTDNPPTNIVNGTDLGDVTTYVPTSTLTNATTYYWQVIAYNPIGDATGCAIWSFTTHPDAPLAGDYTVGLTEFNRITGKNIYFEQVVTNVMTEVDVEVPVEKGTNPDKTSFKPKTESKLMEVEEISWIPMENGEPYTGELYVYKASSPQYNYPEGTDGIYATITAAVADLNVRGASVAVNFLLTDASYTTGETYPIVIDFPNPASSMFTIKPNTGVTALVQGSSPSGQVFMVLSSYVTIDGSNAGGTDRSLTLENTSTTSPQVVAIGSVGDVPITDVTLKNSVVINGAQTSSAVVISDGIAPGSPGYFNDITVQNNHIQKAYIGAYCNAFVVTGNGSGLLLTENDLDSAGTQAIRLVGLYVQGVDGATLSHNNIANFDGATSEDDKGIWLATGNTNATVEKNYIHSLKYTGTGGYGAQGIVVSSVTLNANILIKNNMIYDISGDGWGVSIPGDNPYGIYIFGSIAQSGIKIYHNSINLFGNTLSSTNAISAGIAIGTNSSGELQDNIIVNNLGVDDLGVGSIGVWLQSDSTQLETSNYNDIFVNATGSGVNYVGQIATTGYADLAGWQTGSGADANSISADPGFISNTDLHIDTTSTTVSGKGIYLASVTTDIDGDTRLDPPDIGADEYEASTATFAFTVNVGNGWNMVSVPGNHPVDMHVDTWWSGKDPAAGVFKYQGGYVPVDTTKPSEGYWMKNVGPQVYNYSGIGIVPHNDVPLAQGWNLIGLYELTELTATLQTSPPGIITTAIFEYSGGYNPATDIVPGYGYWAKADQAGSIINLSAPPLGKKSGEVVEYFKEDWGKIILTDASGINYTLYAVTGQVDLDKYELPPMPPAGMFDIRYGSGRIAEDINSSIQEIQMTGVTYPLTVKVEGMDIRVMDVSGKTINVNLKSGEDVVISDATIQKLMVTGELIPTVYALEQNYPNPFNPSTTIEFSLPEDVNSVKLSIYNVLGEKVAELVNTSLIAGKYQYQWNGTSIASGMYIYELRTDKFVSVKKMMLLK